MNADLALEKNIEALTRTAFVRAMQEDHPPQMGLNQCVEKTLLAGLAAGDIAPMSESEFHEQVMTELQQPMGGLFKKLKKAVKKVAKKTGISSAVKFAGRTVKTVAKKTVKAVKKVAPYAAGAAAIYYGAPYVMKGGAALYNKAKSLIGGRVSPTVQQGGQIAGSALQTSAINKATNFASQMLAAQGVNMQSPESQQALQQYMTTQTPQYMPRPPAQVVARGGQYAPEQKTDLMKYALPVAGVIATALLLK